MTATYVKQYTASAASGSSPTNTTVTISGATAGHYLIACLFTTGNPTVNSAPAGWTFAESDSSTGTAWTGVWYKVATSADVSGANYTWQTTTGSNSSTFMVVLEYSGVSGIAAHSGVGAYNAYGQVTGPTIAATAANQMTVLAANLYYGYMQHPPSGWTGRFGTTSAYTQSAWEKRWSNAQGATLGGETWGSSRATAAGDYFGMVMLLLSENSAPNAPTLTSPANNATIDRGIVQRFAWTFSDPDAGDSQSKFDLQYRVVNTTPWTTVSSTTPNTFYDFAASTFAAGNYEWQVRTYDSQGVVGPWCSSSFFTAADAPPQPTITAPTSGATVQNTATLTWSAPNQTDYQWRRVKDNAGSADTSTIYQDSGDVVDSTTRSVTLTFDTNNRYEHIQVRIKNAGLWSSWADIRVQVSYTPPTTATFTMAADPTAATRTLAITNPAPGSGVPATSYNDVYVRTAASSTVLDTYRPYSATGTRIGTQLATNTAFVDRAPAGSPVVYEYRVVSVASNGTASDSGWVSTA